MYAHYFSGRGRKFLVISGSTAPVGAEFEVTGKAEARRIAQTHGATPWNF